MSQPASNIFQTGDVINGTYEVLGKLGSGGMGTVYKVRHLFLQKELALKTVNKRNLADNTIRRFHQEARTAGSLQHPNIVGISDFGLLEDQRPFLVMELVKGLTLAEIIKRNGRLKYQYASLLVEQISAGLTHAHSKGIVHRDIKPSNIVVDHIDYKDELRTDAVKIVDFGIAKLLESEDGELQALTRTGEIFGSPCYISPEQITSNNVDHRTDVYSLGCVVFEALTGAPPYRGNNALETMSMHQNEKVPNIRARVPELEFPDELVEMVNQMLEKNPVKRPGLSEVSDVVQRVADMSSDQLSSLTDRRDSLSQAPKQQQQQQQQQPRNRMPLPVVLSMTIVLGIGAIYFATTVKRENSDLTVRHTQTTGVPKKNREFVGNLSSDVVETSLRHKLDPRITVRYQGMQKTVTVPPELGRIIHKDGSKYGVTEVVIPKDTTVFLTMNRACDLPSNFFSTTDPDLVESLSVENNLSLKDASLKGIERWHNLCTVYVSRTSITDDCIPILSKISKLTDLQAINTRITEGGFQRLPQLPSLTRFACSNLRDPKPVLTRLKNSTSLDGLALNSSNLTNDDLATIATCRNLQMIWIKKNPKITETGLAVLTKLKKLRCIDVSGCDLSPRVLDIFKKLPTLGILYIDTENFPETVVKARYQFRIIDSTKDNSEPGIN